MKSHNLQSDISFIKRAFILAIAFSLLFNTSVIMYKHSQGSDFGDLFWENIYVIIMLGLSFLGFSINNMLLKIYAYIIYVTGAMTSYYIYFEDILPTKKRIGNFFAVDSLDDYDNLSLKLVLWVIFSIWVCFYLLKRFDAKDNSNKLSMGVMFTLLILSIANVITPFCKDCLIYLPLEYLHNGYHYLLNEFVG